MCSTLNSVAFWCVTLPVQKQQATRIKQQISDPQGKNALSRPP
jgi:hypothetical protein